MFGRLSQEARCGVIAAAIAVPCALLSILASQIDLGFNLTPASTLSIGNPSGPRIHGYQLDSGVVSLELQGGSGDASLSFFVSLEGQPIITLANPQTGRTSLTIGEIDEQGNVTIIFRDPDTGEMLRVISAEGDTLLSE